MPTIVQLDSNALATSCTISRATLWDNVAPTFPKTNKMPTSCRHKVSNQKPMYLLGPTLDCCSRARTYVHASASWNWVCHLYSDCRGTLRSIGNPFFAVTLLHERSISGCTLSETEEILCTFAVCQATLAKPVMKRLTWKLLQQPLPTTTLLLLAFVPGIIIPIGYFSAVLRHRWLTSCGRILGPTNWEQSKSLFLLGVPPAGRIVSMKSFCHDYVLDTSGWRINICEVMNLLFVMIALWLWRFVIFWRSVHSIWYRGGDSLDQMVSLDLCLYVAFWEILRMLS